MGFGNHAATNAGEDRHSLLGTLDAGAARHRFSRPSTAGENPQALGRARLLHARPQSPEGRPASRAGKWRRVPKSLRRRPRAVRHWALHGRRDHQHRLQPTLAHPRRQRHPRAHPPLRHRGESQRQSDQCETLEPGGRTRPRCSSSSPRPSPLSPLTIFDQRPLLRPEPIPHGTRRAYLHAETAALRRLSAQETVRRPRHESS